MQKRAQALFYLTLVFVSLLVLAAGLPNLIFQPAMPIPGVGTQAAASLPAAGGAPGAHVSLQMLLQTGLGLGFIFLLALLVFSLLRKASLKNLARLAAGLAAVVFVMVLVGLLKLPQPQTAPLGGDESAPAAGAWTYAVAPIGDPPAGLMDLVLYAALAAAAGLGGWLLYRALQRPDGDPLAAEAAAALRAIEEGQDLRDVIPACYLQMARAVKSGRGLDREEFMTPREFEALLCSRGLPPEPVRRLTALFEKVRYGRARPGSRDEADAVACLKAIRLACGRGETA